MRYFQETFAIAQRILTELVRRRRSLLFWGIFPSILLILNGLIIEERAAVTRSDAFGIAAAPTLVGAALFFSCLGGSVSTVVSEREQQTLKRLFLSPLSGFSYFSGIFIAHCVIGLGQGGLVVAIARLQGAVFEGSFWLSMLILMLSIAAYVGVGFVLGTQLARRTEDVNALVAAFGVPLLILSGAFLPTSLFPDSLLRIAELNPVYHMIEAMTAAMGGEEADLHPHLGFLVSFAILMVGFGWLSYLRMISVERRL